MQGRYRYCVLDHSLKNIPKLILSVDVSRNNILISRTFNDCGFSLNNRTKNDSRWYRRADHEVSWSFWVLVWIKREQFPFVLFFHSFPPKTMNSKHRLLQPDVAWTVFTHCDGDQHFPFTSRNEKCKHRKYHYGLSNSVFKILTKKIGIWKRKIKSSHSQKDHPKENFSLASKAKYSQ